MDSVNEKNDSSTARIELANGIPMRHREKQGKEDDFLNPEAGRFLDGPQKEETLPLP